MIKNELFFHEQTPDGRSLGFSVRFLPATGADEVNQFGERMVWMASTKCNRKDGAFNKKIARAVLRDREAVLVRCKDVPAKLRGLLDESKYGKTINEFYIQRAPTYDNVLKKFL
jgi:hypothetical protein